MAFSTDVLRIDVSGVAGAIQDAIRQQVRFLHRRGAVVGLSGGIDSSVVTCLCARALGAPRVQVLLMPERDSSSDALTLGRLLTTTLGVPALVEDITPVLEAAGCYRRQIEAIRAAFPEYGDGYRCKISLPSILDSNRLNVSELTIATPSGEVRKSRLSAEAYQQMVAATNFKQRVRKMTEYY